MSVQGGHLLVVDDNEMNRDVLSRRLERQGHTVETANNGRQALEQIRAASFDLVLLDIMMPEMNGYEVLEQMKADPALRHIPVIMISAVGEMDSVVRCIEMGAEDYLPKPFSPVLLKARIGACLDKKWLHDHERATLAQAEKREQQVNTLVSTTLPPALAAGFQAGTAITLTQHETASVLVWNALASAGAAELDPATLSERLAAYGLTPLLEVGGGGAAFAEGAQAPRLCVEAGQALLQSLGAAYQVHIGLHAGPLTVGVMSEHLYGLPSATLDLARTVALLGAPNQINVSRALWEALGAQAHGQVRGNAPGGLIVYSAVALA